MALVNCKECSQLISSEAVACPSCGIPVGGATSSKSNFELPLLGIPFVGGLLSYFWVSSMSLLQSPSDALALIMVGTVVGTALFASLEAKSSGAIPNKAAGLYSPTAWFFLISLLWIIGYPVYMYRRKAYGQKNRLVGSIAVTIFFVFLWGVMSAAVEAKKAEVRSQIENMQQQLKSFSNEQQ